MENPEIPKFITGMPQLTGVLLGDAVSIKYTQSGWRYGQPKFHVLIENGETDNTEYRFMTMVEISNEFGVSPELFTDNHFLISEAEVNNLPNDQDLGRFVRRKLFNQ